MIVQKQLHNVDSLWELVTEPANQAKRYYLIDGELHEMSPASRLHGRLAIKIGSLLLRFVEQQGLGEVNTEVGYHPPENRHTLLTPDVAFVSQARLNQQPQDKFIALMPDLAVEIASPSNTLPEIRRKAAVYLEHGARLVWIVLPAQKGVEVCRLVEESRLEIEFVPQTGKLSGEELLPGFELELGSLFPLSESN